MIINGGGGTEEKCLGQEKIKGDQGWVKKKLNGSGVWVKKICGTICISINKMYRI